MNHDPVDTIRTEATTAAKAIAAAVTPIVTSAAAQIVAETSAIVTGAIAAIATALTVYLVPNRPKG